MRLRRLTHVGLRTQLTAMGNIFIYWSLTIAECITSRGRVEATSLQGTPSTVVLVTNRVSPICPHPSYLYIGLHSCCATEGGENQQKNHFRLL